MVAEEIAPEMKKKDVQKKASFTKTDVENIWKTFIQKVEQEFPSLVFILNMTKIVSVENNALTLSADYSFHQDKLMEPRSQQRLAEILSETLGTRAHIIAIVSDSTPKKEDPELKELTSAFGGKVVT
jgi:hypothetical protein